MCGSTAWPLRRASACAKMNGLPRHPRATITPSQPVVVIMRRQSRAVNRSPEPMTGTGQAFFSVRDVRPLRRPAEPLRARPGVQGHQRGACRDGGLGAGEVRVAGRVPAQAELHGNGGVRLGLHGRHDGADEGGVAEEQRAALGLQDLGHGTTAVQVHDRRAQRRDPAHRGGGHRRAGGEDLEAGERVLGGHLEQAQGRPVVPRESVGGRHLGEAQARALLRADRAEGGIRVPGHRREPDVSRDGQGGDGDAVEAGGVRRVQRLSGCSCTASRSALPPRPRAAGR